MHVGVGASFPFAKMTTVIINVFIAAGATVETVVRW